MVLAVHLYDKKVTFRSLSNFILRDASNFIFFASAVKYALGVFWPVPGDDRQKRQTPLVARPLFRSSHWPRAWNRVGIPSRPRPNCARGIWTLKTRQMFSDIKCFSSTLRLRNLKMEISVWKLIKCFPTSNVFGHTAPEECWKWRFHFENSSNVFRRQMFFVHTAPEEFENGDFSVKAYQCFPPALQQRNFKAQK